MSPQLREQFGIPMPPGFEVAGDGDVLIVRCEWCGLAHVYSMAGYHPNAVQADALYHRVDCHTPSTDVGAEKGGEHRC